MARAKDKGEESGPTIEIEDELDALFKLPLTDFIVARNALAARLKKAGRGDEAERVKALVKPSISAWAVNQLHWRHRDAFDRLIAAGERFRRAHTSQLAGKTADIPGALAARREALTVLLRLAGTVLRDTGHSTAPDTMHRINTTLEALSTYSSFADAPSPGRLTGDVDPPGFESLAALIPAAGPAERPLRQSARVIPFRPTARSLPAAADERRVRIASAKAALEAAEVALHKARAMAQEVAAVGKTLTAHAKEAEEHRREAEERFAKASAAAEQARRQMQSAGSEMEKAGRAVADAEGEVERAREELLHAKGE